MSTNSSYFRAVAAETRRTEEEIKAKGVPLSEFAQSIVRKNLALVPTGSAHKPA